jgi:SNF2 family DNA or RNA helicase
VQNNMTELWSLLHFLNPLEFDNLEQFQRWFHLVSSSRKKEGLQEVLDKLHKVLKPYLLRRVKADVLLDLKEKTEFVVYTGLSQMQKK